jgi:hypothetical protein
LGRAHDGVGAGERKNHQGGELHGRSGFTARGPGNFESFCS